MPDIEPTTHIDRDGPGPRISSRSAIGQDEADRRWRCHATHKPCGETGHAPANNDAEYWRKQGSDMVGECTGLSINTVVANEGHACCTCERAAERARIMADLIGLRSEGYLHINDAISYLQGATS